MSTRKKDLYFDSFDDLLSRTEIAERIQSNSAKFLCKSAKGVYSSAQQYIVGGDEELAFIFFMRYCKIITLLQAKPDYRKQEAVLKPLFGGNDYLKNALSTAELLKKSLIARYKERDHLRKSSSINSSKNGNDYSMITSTPNVVAVPKEVSSQLSISVKQLFEIIQSEQNNVLIIDCRSETDFKNSKLNYTFCVNVPEDIIMTGMSAGKVQSRLSDESKTLWTYRSVKEQIILMDWESMESDLSAGVAPISILKNILINWDQDVLYKNPILILNRGYKEFMEYYPTLTTKVVTRHPKQSAQIVNLQDIEYDSVQEVPMKDENIFQPFHQQPSIDRSSKAAAEKLYNKGKLLEEKESLTDRLLLNEQNILQKITELREENVQKYNGDESKLAEARLNIKNERIELEDNLEELNRMKSENDRMRQRLEEEIAKNKQFQLDADSKLNEEVEKRIAEKERKEREFREKRKLLDEERREREGEELMEKRRRETEMAARERLTKPTIPSFDRSAKPHLNYVDEQTIVRRFLGEGHSAGAGLTGLANLYNNCYMNNIVQCLSNTSDLLDYFLSNKYKQHINRSNETCGRIAEELCAVFKEIWCKEHAYISSNDFRSAVGHFQPLFSGGDHQDSHEFLRILIDWMHSDLEILISDIPKVHLTAADKAWFSFVKNKESLIFRLFYGQYKSTLKCTVCNCESATYDSFSDLSLPVPSITKDLTTTDIQQCLDNFFFGEYIDDWECPKCQIKRRAVKKLDISKLPKILVIHFKRFQVDISDSGRLINSSKKQINITFPLMGLNMARHIAPSAKGNNKSKQIYNLYGVSNHYGTLTAGHYTAFCKNKTFQKWFKFDDRKVTQLEPSNVVTSAAYILFYTNETT